LPKVVLAYTGGLATSLCIHWLRMKKGLDVVTFTANVGQNVNLEPIADRAIELGAEAAHIADLRERFIGDFAFSALRAGAVYESGYYLGKALTRPLIVQEMARIAADERAELIAHGCSGRGNDRVRFEAAAAALAPELKVLAPIEEWGLRTRDDLLRYARRYDMEGIFADDAADDLQVAVDQNLWGVARAHDGALVDPWSPLPEEMFRITVAPEKAPDAGEEILLAFKKGVPVRLDGEALAPVAMVERLNALGGKHGIGRKDVIEDRISGIKTREIYEAPAAAILYEAHAQLERLVQAKESLQYQGQLARKYAELVYNGLWFSELREGLDAFFARVQRKVTGDVRVKLHKGRAVVCGVRSPYSLYDGGLARLAVACSEKDDHKQGLRESVSYAIKAGSGRHPDAAPVEEADA
jgi:argininosuccinate synthase